MPLLLGAAAPRPRKMLVKDLAFSIIFLMPMGGLIEALLIGFARVNRGVFLVFVVDRG